MNILDNIYLKALGENENNLRFWQDYLEKLKALDFNVFSDKLKVPSLVPVGSRILFKGIIKHTNEITVALGADYFAKCSIKQAEILRQHRIKGAQSKVEELEKERLYLESQLSFNKQNSFEEKGHEIIEEYNAEQDTLWREKHRENMRLYKQKAKEEVSSENEVTDEELWEKLEELELQEELEKELENMSLKDNIQDHHLDEVICQKDATKCDENHLKDNILTPQTFQNNKIQEEDLNSKPGDKLDLIQKVLDKQIELEEKLHELKNKEQKQSKTEDDLIARLDEMEQLDELEDEMDRLADILENGEIEEIDDKKSTAQIKRSVSFADENEIGDTLEITFTHSEVEPDKNPYDPEKGILKPSDLYDAHKQASETTSILKKSKYSDNDITFKDDKTLGIVQTDFDEPVVKKTIVVKDITETGTPKTSLLESTERTASLFKKRRQQRKS